MKKMNQPTWLFCLFFLFLFYFPVNSDPSCYWIRNVTLVDVIQEKLLFGQDIIIKDGLFQYVGTNSPSICENVLDGSRLVALPGFIDGHTHLWQHFGKSFYPDRKLQEWVNGIYGYSHYFTDEELYKVMKSAIGQAFLSGITTVCDYVHNYHSTAFDSSVRAFLETGMDVEIAFSVPSFFVPVDIRDKELQRYQKIFEKSRNIFRIALTPLSFQKIPVIYEGVVVAQSHKLGMVQHCLENFQSLLDFHDSLERYLKRASSLLERDDLSFLKNLLDKGKPKYMNAAVSSVQYRAMEILLDDDAKMRIGNDSLLSKEERLFLEAILPPTFSSPVPLLEYLEALSDKFLSIHSVWQTVEDREIYMKHRTPIVHNPQSNIYLSSGIAPIVDYIRRDIIVGLGTDGAASNDGIDYFNALKLFVNLQKVNHLDLEAISNISSWTALKAATIGGAKSLNREKQTGSITVGKDADLILLSLDRLGMSPFDTTKENGIDLIVNSATIRDIAFVFSNGKMVVKDSALVQYDEAELARDLTDASNAIVERFNNGKAWNENFHLKNDKSQGYWYAYQYINEKDEINLSLQNANSYDSINITIVSSGNSSTIFYHPDVAKRFPDPDRSGWFQKTVPLQPLEHIQILKKKNQKEINLQLPEGSDIISNFSTTTLLVYVRYDNQ